MSSVSGYSSYDNYNSVLEALNTFNETNGTTASSTSSNSTVSNLVSNSSKTGSLSAETISYLTDIKNGATAMQSALSKIIGSNSKFTNLQATSSNKDVVTVSGSSTLSKSMEVQVAQLATKQINTGTALNSKSADTESGKYDFTITLDNGKEKKFSIDVNDGDTNEDIQKKVATAINKDLSTGVGASVVYNNDGTSSLKLTAKNTGTNNSFKVSGDISDKLGLNNTTQQAQNAKYSVDGEVHYSQSNNIDLGNGISATLKSESTEAVTVGYAPDEQGMMDSIKELVNTYNDLLSTAGDSDNAGAKKLVNQIRSLAETYGTSLKGIGISTGSDGKLSIDEDKLKTAASDGSLALFMKSNGDGKSNYGFLNRLDRLATDVNKNPANYYKETEDSSASSVAGLDRDFTLSDFSFSQISLLNKYDTVGLLFDMFA